MLRSLLVCLFLCSLGCSGKVGDMAADFEAEATLDAKSEEVIIQTDAVDTSADSFDLRGDHNVEIPVLACDPGEGCFMDKCAQNSDCDSGWCVDNMGEGVCTNLCEEECPPGWNCAQIAGSAPDVVFACVSNYANLCRPCNVGKDCESLGGAEDVCVDYGDVGSFCGGKCSETSPCPYGFACQQAMTVDGIETVQCVALSGVCPCTKKSVELSLWTSCAVSNDWGECTGKRVCKEEGLSDCDAPTPGQEICNGEDDDCDGDVDEPDEVDGDLLNLCDDGNECTKDMCKGEEGCENEILDTGECMDGDTCTAGDHCESGLCIGNPVVCEDDNTCTDDKCDGFGGCLFENNLADCDDGNPCTLTDQCKDGTCSGVEMPCQCQEDADCEELEDGDLCNGTLFCGKGVFPFECAVGPDTIIVCPAPMPGPDAFCLEAACDPLSGVCSFVADHEGFVCDNGDACTVNDKCVEGVCTGGVESNCNDGNPCTDDNCDPEAGCLHSHNTLACEDGNVCTTGDACQDSVCKGGGALVCDDGNMCNGVETCDPKTGCKPGEPLVCDDGNQCNGLEECDSESGCLPGLPVDCEDGNPCTSDACVDGQCEYNPAGGLCDDGNACTDGDHCTAGKCAYSSVVKCEDGNVCTTNFCDPANGCISEVSDNPCDDGNMCTTEDTCSMGQCQGGPSLSCDDGNVCNGTETCDVKTGCKPGTPLACDDGVLCTVDSCDPMQGCQHELLTPCCGDAICAPNEGCLCPVDCASAEVCDGKDNDCDGETDEAVKTVGRWLIPCGSTVQDSKSGSIWTANAAQNKMPWADAKTYCDNLVLDGIVHWRLPKIQELRTLVDGCQGTTEGGKCLVLEDPPCISTSCFFASDNWCHSCGANNGPGEDGCYWTAGVWTGLCTRYWTSAVPTDLPSNAWTIVFSSGAVDFGESQSVKWAVRCVAEGQID